jgi:hypothetical protein
MDNPAEPPDMAAELLDRLDEIEAEFREDFGLDIDYAPNPRFKTDSNHDRFENSLAKVLLKDVDALVASSELLRWRENVGNVPVGDLAKVIANFRLVKPQILLDLARRDLRNLDAKSRRTVDLLAILIAKRPSEGVAAYLQRVANCYIHGLDPECIVMCRAVLDSAFESTISATQVLQALPGSRTRGVHLADRIEAAERLALITRTTARLARKVKDAGNDAIHNVPVATLTPLEAVVATVKVLETLL